MIDFNGFIQDVLMVFNGLIQGLVMDFNGLIQDVFTKEEPLGLVLMAVPIYITGLIMIGTLFTCKK
ncbi:hypothetical protein ACE21V_002014 [Salmonella enterica]|nr:hypothetical protein [Salmonella enterica subsp. enterica serovar Stanley]